MTQADLTVSICPTHDDYFVHYLQEEYGIPAVLKDMPIGLENTRNWLREIAGHFGLEANAEAFIAAETAIARQAVTPFLPLLQGKRVFFSAGEFRALVTAALFQELGIEIVGLRSYHHDDFGTPYYDTLVQRQHGKDFPVDIANFQPFELTNLLMKIKPDLFVGHITDNVWAAKLGLPTMTIFASSMSIPASADISRWRARRHGCCATLPSIAHCPPTPCRCTGKTGMRMIRSNISNPAGGGTMSTVIEQPRYQCALGGALATIGALPRTSAIIHAAPGCGSSTDGAAMLGSGYGDQPTAMAAGRRAATPWSARSSSAGKND